MKDRIKNTFLAFALLIGVNPALAQTVFTYQGRVSDSGTNFTGTGQFKFALVTSTNLNHHATAIATNTAGFITGIGIVDSGSGYTVPPAVSITGAGGSGAQATALISGGAVTHILVNNAGSGYIGTPTVTIAPPSPNLVSTTCWNNDGSAGSEPAAAVDLGVVNGLFTVVLGDTSLPNMTAIDASLFTRPNLQLQIWFGDGGTGSVALNPPQSLTPTLYAVFANTASNLSGTLPTTQLTGTIPIMQLSGTPSTATNFAGNLDGDVTGTQTATVVSTVGGRGASQIANATILATAAGDSNSPNVIVKRDANGSFSSGSVSLAGNLDLPATAANSGMINSAGGRLLHAYGFASTFVGGYAGNFTLTGGDNTGVGFEALYQLSSGQDNTATGRESLRSDTVGLYNTADGSFALYWLASGQNNTAVGYNSLYALTGGNGNTAVGTAAFDNMTSGGNNIALGFGAGQSITTGDNNIFIGNGGSDGDSGIIRIGTPGTHLSASIAGIYNHAVAGGAAVYVVASGQLGTLPSSRKFKRNIKDMDDASDVLMALRPVTFRYNPEIDPEGIPQFGLVAEDVEKVDRNLVVHDAEHGIYTVRYQAVDAMLLNEFIKEHRVVEEQNAQIQALQQNMAELRKILQSLAERK